MEPIASDPGLPNSWWQALPIDRACATVGPAQIAAKLADLTSACWGHLILGDIMPLLRFTAPAESQRTPGSRDSVRLLFAGVLDRLMDTEPLNPLASVPPAVPERPLPEIIDELFQRLDDRQRAIARDRLYAEHRATLDELAQRFSVTRERIRQIERDLRDHVDNWLRGQEATPLTAHLTWLRTRLGSAVPADDLAAAVPWHRTELGTLGIPAWRFVRTLLTGYDQVDGWLVAGAPTSCGRRRGSCSPTGPCRWPRRSAWSRNWASAKTSGSAGSGRCRSCGCWKAMSCRGREA